MMKWEIRLFQRRRFRAVGRGGGLVSRGLGLRAGGLRLQLLFLHERLQFTLHNATSQLLHPDLQRETCSFECNAVKEAGHYVDG